MGNTRIIEPQIYSLAKKGCINVHPALLPEVKGIFPIAWSVYYDVPIGCTCHFIDSEVDTGDIISKKTIDVDHTDTLAVIMQKTVDLSAHLIIESLQKYQQNLLSSTPQESNDNNVHLWPSEEVLNTVYTKLKNQEYKHYKTA